MSTDDRKVERGCRFEEARQHLLAQLGEPLSGGGG